jgi:pimeloyl-ACP methyl ester carboxylesterase
MLEDPLDRKKMSGREIFGTLWFIGRTPLALKHIKRDLPVLVVQGGRDGIVRPCSVPPLLKQVKSSEKKMVVFPKYGHVLVGTNYIKPDVQSTIDTWLDTHVSTRIGGGGNISAVRSVSP